MKYLFLAVSLCFLITYGSIRAIAEPKQEVFPISEAERAALVSGVVMGIDVANAGFKLPPMTKAKWLEFAHIFDDATAGCQDIRCVTDNIVKLRDTLYQKSLGNDKRFSPNGPEILR